MASEMDFLTELELELEMLEGINRPMKRDPLTQAVQNGDQDALLRLLADHAGDQEVLSAITQAINDDNFDALVILMSKIHGSFCFLHDDNDVHLRTPLMFAADKGRYDMVSLLLARGSEIDARDTMDRTALYYAICGSHEAIALLLLDHKRHTAAEGTDENSNCVLTLAIMANMVDAVDRLISLGADLEETDMDGMTPLHNAARWRSHEALELLVRAGADVNAQVEASFDTFSGLGGFSALMFAVRNIRDGCGTCPGCKRASSLASDSRSLDFLLEHGADPSLRNTSGKHVIDIALSEDKSAIPFALLRLCSDDVLISTASSATSDALRVVLSLDRVTIHCLDSNGWTMLMHAAAGNSPEVCRMLLSSGAQVLKDLDDWSPMILAAKHGRAENIKLFLPGSAEDRTMAIRFALRHRQIEALNVLLCPGGAPMAHGDVASDPLTPRALSIGARDLAIEELSVNTGSSASTSRTCACCLHHESSVVFLPCKHLSTCPDCACKVSQCPLCRVPVRERIAVYSS